MLPTPSTSHVSFDNVYEPAEDSYLVLDTLSSASETAFLSQRFPVHAPAPLALEIGTGSGVVLAFISAHARKLFGHTNVITLGTDVNGFACRAARETVQVACKEHKAEAGIFTDVVAGDLASPLRARKVDVLVFNPPYVPTEELPALPDDLVVPGREFERDSYLLSLSYAGGEDGMETTKRLLDSLGDILSERGVAYVLLCARNRPDEVAAGLRDAGWDVEVCGRSGKVGGWEKLVVLRIWRD
ncbi:putative methylase [Trichodelitschia bisporula]|uniref:Putative methylase n=1 Tax=Trichodelitschia bisporula TaxID=703511 RepID=A0A6G1HV27_9PEZI|nr:putative methylase [Trichodelitschia bisporula]